MSNKEKLQALNKSFKKIVQHSQTIENCSQQCDDLISRLEQIKLKKK